ncbi:MBL fold metallo-hydrolase [uncultured Polaribacter sp.]|uniref:MBL fold metallo-hydrolase n=1 Tax=uncultured Polaribacter sp. TaxID=174711 RepID=UPI0032B25D74|tara:strand:- start:79 stop:1014 length:936 start_codon:yes stop_codon:yes gene_type:complete
MKKIIVLFVFSVVPFFCVSQDSDFSKYNTQIRDVKKEVTYFEIEKINNQFYMLVGGGGNVGVFISDQNVVLIDNKYEIMEDILMTSLKKITDKPIEYIINTHFHHDHSDGNRAFGKKGIPIIAHQNAKKRMMEDAELYGGIYSTIKDFVQPKYDKSSLPVFTYESKMTISQGNEEIELYNFGNAHTDGDSVVVFKNNNIIHTGDAFVRYGYPYVDLNNGGSIKGLIDLLGALELLCDANTIIMPGHGSLSKKEDVVNLKNTLNDLYNKTIIGLKNGLSYNEISDSIEETLNGDEIVKLNYIKSIELESFID